MPSPRCRCSMPTARSLWLPRAGESAFAQHAYEEAVVWFARALAAAPPDTVPRWRAELLVLSGEAHRHIGDIGAARRAFVNAAELTDDPALLARAALGYADPGADLGIAYRTDDAVTAALLERAIAAQPSSDSVIAVQLEARLAAELYFSDEPFRAREHAQSALDRARRLGDARALGAATAVVHDSFVVGQARFDEQLRRVGPAARLGSRQRIGVRVADRAPRPCDRSPRRRRDGRGGCRDPRVPSARRAAPRSGLSVVAGVVVGDARPSRRAPRRGRGAGLGCVPDRRGVVSVAGVPQLVLPALLPASRAGPPRRDGAGRPATTQPRMPTSRRYESRSRSCSPSSAGSTRPAARWPRSTKPRSSGCTTATGRRRGSSWRVPRRSSVIATSPPPSSSRDTVRPSDASRSRSPRSASERPIWRRRGCSTPSATSMRRSSTTDRRRSSTPASVLEAGSPRLEPITRDCSGARPCRRP